MRNDEIHSRNHFILKDIEYSRCDKSRIWKLCHCASDAHVQISFMCLLMAWSFHIFHFRCTFSSIHCIQEDFSSSQAHSFTEMCAKVRRIRELVRFCCCCCCWKFKFQNRALISVTWLLINFVWMSISTLSLFRYVLFIFEFKMSHISHLTMWHYYLFFFSIY